jgi:hypothetical protein
VNAQRTPANTSEKKATTANTSEDQRRRANNSEDQIIQICTMRAKLQSRWQNSAKPIKMLTRECNFSVYPLVWQNWRLFSQRRGYVRSATQYLAFNFSNVDIAAFASIISKFHDIASICFRNWDNMNYEIMENIIQIFKFQT